MVDMQRAAFYAAINDLKKKLRGMAMTVDFYPELPMRMVVVKAPERGTDQQTMGFEPFEDEESFSIELIMCSWGEVQYIFDGKGQVPAKLMNTLKRGFLAIAGAYLMMQHALNVSKLTDALAAAAKQRENEE